MENKQKKQNWNELTQDELEQVNGGVLPGIRDDDDQDDDDNSGGGATGGW